MANEYDVYNLALIGDTDEPVNWVFHWGDSTETCTLPGDSVSYSHMYSGGPATYAITATAEVPTLWPGWIIDVTGPVVQVLNVPPTANFVSDGPVNEGGNPVTVRFENIGDPSASDTSQLRYSYDFDDDGVYEISDVSDTSQSHLFTQSGEYEVNGRVSHGVSFSEYSVLVTVNNLAPTASINSISGKMEEGTDVTATGSATDPGGADNTLSYMWAAYRDDVIRDVGDGNTFTFTATHSGDWQIELTVTDSDGATDTATTPIFIANVAPHDAAISGPDSGTVGRTVGFTGSATDPGQVEETLTYAWIVTSTATNQTVATEDGNYLAFTPDAAGNYGIQLTVTDEDGASCSASESIDIANLPPENLTITPAPGNTYEEGSQLQFTAAGWNPTGDAEGISYSWSLAKPGETAPAAPAASGSGAEFTFTVEEGCYTLTLVGSNGAGSSSSVSIPVQVANVAPQNVSIVPASGNVNESGNSVSYSASATDPGTDDKLSYAWYVTQAGQVDPVAFGTNSSFSFTPTGGAYVITLVVSDGEGGCTSASRVEQVAASGPTISSLGLTIAAPNGTTTNPSISGQLDGAGGYAIVEADVNADGAADVTTYTSDGKGEFTLDLSSVIATPGEVTVRVRRRAGLHRPGAGLRPLEFDHIYLSASIKRGRLAGGIYGASAAGHPGHSAGGRDHRPESVWHLCGRPAGPADVRRRPAGAGRRQSGDAGPMGLRPDGDAGRRVRRLP